VIKPDSKLSWRRTSKCASGNCVEVAKAGDRVLVRNSAEPDVVVNFSTAEWVAFIDGSQEFR
jgi:hypothetical protein